MRTFLLPSSPLVQSRNRFSGLIRNPFFVQHRSSLIPCRLPRDIRIDPVISHQSLAIRPFESKKAVYLSSCKSLAKIPKITLSPNHPVNAAPRHSLCVEVNLVIHRPDLHDEPERSTNRPLLFPLPPKLSPHLR